MVTGEKEWFDDGLKELSKCVDRHEKSVGKAVKTLERKKLIQKKRDNNRVALKHTLSNDELYTRMTLLDPMLCSSESINELLEDLLREIERVEKEILQINEKNFAFSVKDSMIDSIVDQVEVLDFDGLIKNMKTRTYANSNKTIDEMIQNALKIFRDEVFVKYGKLVEDFDTRASLDETYDEFWSHNKR